MLTIITFTSSSSHIKSELYPPFKATWNLGSVFPLYLISLYSKKTYLFVLSVPIIIIVIAIFPILKNDGHSLKNKIEQYTNIQRKQKKIFLIPISQK